MKSPHHVTIPSLDNSDQVDLQHRARELADAGLLREADAARKQAAAAGEQRLMSGEKRHVPKRTGGPVSF